MSAPARAVRHAAFGPRAISVAEFLRDIGLVPADDILGVLAEIDRRWPQLSMHDFHGAAVLAQAFAVLVETRGSA
jgi:hypothetical protein